MNQPYTNFECIRITGLGLNQATFFDKVRITFEFSTTVHVANAQPNTKLFLGVELNKFGAKKS